MEIVIEGFNVHLSFIKNIFPPIRTISILFYHYHIVELEQNITLNRYNSQS